MDRQPQPARIFTAPAHRSRPQPPRKCDNKHGLPVAVHDRPSSTRPLRNAVGGPRVGSGVTNNDLHDALHQMLTAVDGGVLAPLKRDGRPQLINVNHHYDPAERVIRFSVSDGDAKTHNLRRDPRASYHVPSPDARASTVAEA